MILAKCFDACLGGSLQVVSTTKVLLIGIDTLEFKFAGRPVLARQACLSI